MIAPEVVAFTEEPVFIAVAVADAALRPSVYRGARLVFDGDRAHVVIASGVEAPEELAARLTGRRAALVVSAPTRIASFQLKGDLVSARVATDEEVAEGRRRLAVLGEQVERVQGVPATLYRDFPFHRGVALEVVVTECYDQTPGARAGARLGP